MSNKLTDNEIIKALEYCKDCSANLNVEIIDFITRQQAENKNLKVENQSLRSAANSLKMHYEEAQAEIERLKSCVKSEDEVREIAKRTMEPLVKEITREQIDIAVKLAKSEAVKAFAERLKNEINCRTTLSRQQDKNVIHIIHNLLKETVGDDE